MPVYTVERDSTIEEAVYDVDPLVDTANPFGDYAVVKIDDRGGEKFDKYERGTRIDITVDDSDLQNLFIASGETQITDAGTTDSYLSVSNAGTYENAGTVEATAVAAETSFTGYVVERRETEQAGADALEVEAYTFDQFLRRNTVTNDQTGNLISEALQDIIETDTPVAFNAANVDVGDDQELTRSYQGEAVENVLRDFAFKSNNEEFGVADDLEFFFRERETDHIDRGIDNTQWFNYDIPELGKEAINEVEVWFNGGEESVIVDDGTDKLDLQDSLGLPDPGTQRHELNRPLVTDINDAEDIGRKYLAFRNSTLSGTVTTFGLFGAEPGDTIDIEIAPRGIDTEFVIAATEYRWAVDQTILTIVEKRGDVDDILTELNDSVQRVEMNGANRDAPSNRITTTTATAIVDVTTDADGNTPTGNRFVNDGRRAVRDAWTGDAPPDIDTLVVGDDGTGLSRSNTALRNQTNSASLSQSLPTATSVEFSATITQTGVEELGIEAADGTLIARAVFDTPVDLDGTVTVTLAVSNDDSVSRGVITTTGQAAVRDILADNSPATPTDYAYGSDDTPVAESDTALGNELVTADLIDVLVAEADTNAEWQDLRGTIPADVPQSIANDEFGGVDVCDPRDALDNNDGEEGSIGALNGDEYNDGQAADLSAVNQAIEFDFTFDYDIPASRVGIAFRNDSSNDVNATISWNGTTLTTISTTSPFSLQWDFEGDRWFDANAYEDNIGTDINAGDTNTLRVEITGTSNWGLDCVAVFDENELSELTFPNPDAATNGGGILDGPERATNQTATLQQQTTRRRVTEANVSSTWDDISNNQFLELAIIDGNFQRTNNSETATVSVSDANADRTIEHQVGLSRFTTDATTIPATGDTPQRIDDYQLTANVAAVTADDIGATLARGIVPPNTITGSTVREAGIKSNGSLLTRHVVAEFTLLQDQRLASSETTRFTGDE